MPLRQPPPLTRRQMLRAAGALWPFGAVAADEPTVVTLSLPDASLELTFEPGFEPPAREALAGAVSRAAAVVRSYLGRFPVPALELQFEAVPGPGLRAGSTHADPEPWIRLRAGQASTPAALADDWILVHEMLHLALPRVPVAQAWLHEGMATYGEAVACCRAGWFDAGRLWRGLVLGMARGVPAAGDAGLDHTPTWARTYWGGALWCLQADLALLQASAGRLGWRQALQALLAAGADHRQAWDAGRILRTADAALSLRVLEPLYERHRASAVVTDLPALWQALGVGGPQLDEQAPLAALRRAITA